MVKMVELDGKTVVNPNHVEHIKIEDFRTAPGPGSYRVIVFTRGNKCAVSFKVDDYAEACRVRDKLSSKIEKAINGVPFVTLDLKSTVMVNPNNIECIKVRPSVFEDDDEYIVQVQTNSGDIVYYENHPTIDLARDTACNIVRQLEGEHHE